MPAFSGSPSLVVAHAAQRVVRRLEIRVADQHDLTPFGFLQRLHPVAFLVEHVVRDVHRQLGDDLRRALLARFLADETQNASASDSTLRMLPAPLQRGQIDCVDSSSDGPQPLPRHLEQAEPRDLADLNARAVVAHGLRGGDPRPRADCAAGPCR